MARPSSLTAQKQEAVEAALAAGAPLSVAAAAADVTPRTVSRWLTEGRVVRRRLAAVPEPTAAPAPTVQKLVPDMRCDDVAGGLYGPRDGFLDGHLYTALLAELVTAGGGRLCQRERLVEADVAAYGSHVLTTTAGRHECDFVVNAAGPWAEAVGDTLDAPVRVDPQRPLPTMNSSRRSPSGSAIAYRP